MEKSFEKEGLFSLSILCVMPLLFYTDSGVGRVRMSSARGRFSFENGGRMYASSTPYYGICSMHLYKVGVYEGHLLEDDIREGGRAEERANTEREKARADSLEEKVRELEAIIKKMNQ